MPAERLRRGRNFVVGGVDLNRVGRFWRQFDSGQWLQDVGEIGAATDHRLLVAKAQQLGNAALSGVTEEVAVH